MITSSLQGCDNGPDIGKKMAGRDKANIDDPAVKDTDNIMDDRINIVSITKYIGILVADLVVLAVNATQVAMPEKILQIPLLPEIAGSSRDECKWS